MLSRSILALFAIALIAASVNAAPAEEVDVDEDFERGWVQTQFEKVGKNAAKKVLGFVKEKASRVNWDCVQEVYNECQTFNPITHIRKFIKCGTKYVAEHKDHCYPKAH